MKEENKLFSEFPPVSTEEWENLIIKDLKGADYNKKLIWKTEEGFDVNPYYRAENLADLDYLNTNPAEFPLTRSSKIKDNKWEIVQRIDESDPAKANSIAVDIINKGVGNLGFNVKKIENENDIETLLLNIPIEKTGFKFFNAPCFPKFAKLLVTFFDKQKIDKNKISIVLGFDPLMWYVKNMKFWSSQESDFKDFLQLLEITKDYPHFKVINVNGVFLHNAGATIVQELAYSLSIAHQYLNYAVDNDILLKEFVSKISFSLSISSNYFMEIAKLRAIRLLWSSITNQYNANKNEEISLYINAVSSSWNKTIYDPYVNMLRVTTECMSAAIGGANSILLKPFDSTYKPDDDFSRRISRNVQIILQEESNFDKVVDPAAGSYYIENLTDSIAEHSWNMFKDVEKNGGIIPYIENGNLKKEIEDSCNKKKLAIATRKTILLGTNQYPNINEDMLDKVVIAQKAESSAGLNICRGAEEFEEIRLATEKYAKKSGQPSVFLLKIGNLAMRQARAGFASNFFGCAGYNIIESSGFDNIDDGVEATFKSKAKLVVICSSDDEYATLGIEAVKKLINKIEGVICVVAGNPQESIAALDNAGVSGYIHVKSNIIETLNKYNKLLFK